MTILRILLTRPESDALRTAARLTALGHRVLIDSLIAIELVAVAPCVTETDAGAAASVKLGVTGPLG